MDAGTNASWSVATGPRAGSDSSGPASTPHRRREELLADIYFSNLPLRPSPFGRGVIAVTVLVAAGVAGMVAGWAAAPGRAAASIGPLIAATGLAVTVWDVFNRRIPNRLMAVTAAGAVLAGVVVAVVDHRQPFAGMLVGALVAGVPLLVVHLVNPGGLGFGDVRYGFVLGGSLGLIHWSLASWALLLASMAALAGMLMERSWRRSVPFGAFLAGSGLSVLFASRVLL